MTYSKKKNVLLLYPHTHIIHRGKKVFFVLNPNGRIINSPTFIFFQWITSNRGGERCRWTKPPGLTAGVAAVFTGGYGQTAGQTAVVATTLRNIYIYIYIYTLADYSRLAAAVCRLCVSSGCSLTITRA